jgi:hypothetical protein
MIRANHTTWAERIFHPYVTWLFKRHFHAIHLLGKPPQTEASLPLLLLPNHSTWWDGFFIYLLNKKLFGRKAYLMMLEEQLARYKFFSRLGAFSIEPRSVSNTRQSLRYAAAIIKQPSSLLCIFPQGELLPWEKRPLGYKRGLEAILRAYGGKVNLLPLAIKTVFLQEQLPEAFFLFGENMIANRNTFIGMQRLEEIEESLLDQISRAIAGGEKGMTLLSGRKSVNVAVDRIRFSYTATLRKNSKSFIPPTDG